MRFRFTIRDMLWLTAVVALACLSALEIRNNAQLRSEAASFQRLADDRKAQFESLAEEWQRQKPKSIKVGDQGRVTIERKDGTKLSLRP